MRLQADVDVRIERLEREGKVWRVVKVSFPMDSEHIPVMERLMRAIWAEDSPEETTEADSLK